MLDVVRGRVGRPLLAITLLGATAALTAACGSVGSSSSGSGVSAATATAGTAGSPAQATASGSTSAAPVRGRSKAQRDQGVAASASSMFEVAQVHPLELTPDGTRLLSTNTANGTLEIFDVSGSSVVFRTVIKVGVDPVTVRALSNDEAWVVNAISDDISVVDLRSGNVVRTLATDDEPADVVFAGTPQRAYVSCAAAQNVMVFDPASPSVAPTRIVIQGEQPRALATSPDRQRVYLAIFESGNGTVSLSGKDNVFEPNIVRDPAGPYGGVSPPPNANNATTFKPALNPANPAPPAGLSLIVRRTANGDWLDDNGRNWKAWVNGGPAARGTRASNRAAGWDLIDRDVAVIDTTTRAVTYQGGLMNIVMSLAVNPATGQVTVVGTDALNQIRFEPIVDGIFLRVLFGGFQPGQANSLKDLNPHLTYTAPSIAVSERQKSIGDPRGIAWNAAGTRAYVTGMGSNNVIVLNSQGNRAGINQTIEVGQGPTGIVLQEAQRRAFVLNRFDATISIVNLDTETVTGTADLSYDPTPQVVRDGRPMLYDTHRFSGLGQISCASCHVDSRTDRLAWDLGDPSGVMVTTGGVQHHPMKGPLLTQTLVDTMQSPFLHWRGDRPTLGHFSGAFHGLQGADNPATDAEIAAMKAFLQTLRTPPNPNRNLDNSYPVRLEMRGPRGALLRVGNAEAGAQEFEANCRSCHPGHTARGAQFLNRPEFSGGNFLNPPRWQNFYRRDGLWFTDATASTTGFGILQDGTFDSTHNATRSDNMMAFMYAFNGSFPYTPAGLDATNVAVDAPAAVGRQVTLSRAQPTSFVLTRLVGLAQAGSVGLVAHGCVNQQRRGYVLTSGTGFQADRANETTTLAALQALAAGGTPITFTAVRAGTQTIIGVDEDANGVLNADQNPAAQLACSLPPSPGVGPLPASGGVACALEGATCTVPNGAVADVYFGAGGQFSRKQGQSGNVACTAAAIGEAATGQARSCVYVVTGATGTIACAADGGNCALPAGVAADVYYGANGKYGVKYAATENVACNVNTFNDVNAGAQKSCFYEVVAAAGAVACGSEAQTCTIPAGASALASYGANGVFATRSNVTGSFVCGVAAFGTDPVPGVLKSCSYTVTATTSSGGGTGGGGSGTGLSAQYFANANLAGGAALVRLEAPNFDWGAGAPANGLPVDNFSVRWSGFLTTAVSGSTLLQTVSDDGVRVWVGGKLVIDNWTPHGPTANNATVTLAAGQPVAIQIEYFELGGGATLRLNWQPAGSNTVAAVPLSALSPAAVGAQNLAAGKTATQISTIINAIAGRAVDGNTNGEFFQNSVTHTADANQPWWQVDLGASNTIQLVQLWNRTDCCADRLQNFVVFVSASDMSARTLDQLKADASVVSRDVSATTSWTAPTIGVPVGAAGRYVRVQLRTTAGPLSLAEVQVFGAGP